MKRKKDKWTMEEHFELLSMCSNLLAEIAIDPRKISRLTNARYCRRKIKKYCKKLHRHLKAQGV